MRGTAAAPRTVAHEGAMRKFLIIVLILVFAAVGWYKWSFPTASYRYRLTISVESDGQVHSGSSVIDVGYLFYPKALWQLFAPFEDRVRGQAVLIDLGAHGTLVAALHSGTGSGHVGVNADALAGRAFLSFPASASGFPVTLENVQAISQTRGLVNLAPNNLPPFIWFPDASDVNNAQLVSPGDFASVIGDATHLTEAQLEISDDPIVLDLNKRLPWYNNLKATGGTAKAKTNGAAAKQNYILLGYNAFMNEGTSR
jgi:hypothetical protein